MCVCACVHTCICMHACACLWEKKENRMNFPIVRYPHPSDTADFCSYFCEESRHLTYHISYWPVTESPEGVLQFGMNLLLLLPTGIWFVSIELHAILLWFVYSCVVLKSLRMWVPTCMPIYVQRHVFVNQCVCVCVRERKRERERENVFSDRQCESENKNALPMIVAMPQCVCVCACVCVFV